jgi:3-phenylpropionate/trans-cinnamate dioxygenase ferredoxin component
VEYEIGRLDQIDNQGMCTGTADSVEVVVFRLDDGRLVALEDRCSHADIKLSEGTFEREGAGGTIECFAHGAKFDVCSGRHLCMPAVTPVKAFSVRLDGDRIFVTIPE